jgi:hypothetical protein
MHYKIITPWDYSEAIAQQVKVSSLGLMGHDYSCLVKRAGEEFAHRIRDIEIPSDMTPLHILAMGSTEAYGPNRNGDGFKAANLKRTADTFEKFAHFFRHHKNKDPKKSYGIVKAAFYNEAMHRVELLALLHRTKEAADRHDALVADEEHEALGRGEDIPVSMACKVAFDVCSVCMNKAANRKEYCDSIDDGGKCHGFGCKKGLTQVLKSGHVQHVDNPEPSFFDISKVGKGADRIAYGTVADYLTKAASIDHILGGAELAEAYRISAPLSMAISHDTEPAIADQIKLAYELASLEENLEAYQSPADRNLAIAFAPVEQPPVDLEPLGKVGSHRLPRGLSALAQEKVALPVKDFLRLLLGADESKAASYSESVSARLPGVYNRLISCGDLERDIRENPFRPSTELAPTSQRQWASKLASDFSVSPGRVQQRAALQSIRGTTIPTIRLQPSEKRAEATGEADEALARCYALYKLAFLNAQTDNVTLTAELTILQNYVS